MNSISLKKMQSTEVNPQIKITIDFIRKNLDSMIEQLSIYRDALEIFTENYGLNEEELKLLELLKRNTNAEGKITGKLVHLVQ